MSRPRRMTTEHVKRECSTPGCTNIANVPLSKANAKGGYYCKECRAKQNKRYAGATTTDIAHHFSAEEMGVRQLSQEEIDAVRDSYLPPIPKDEEKKRAIYYGGDAGYTT